MDHHPSGGAGRSGRRPVTAGPDQRPDQEALFAPEEVLPLSTATAVTTGPTVPGPAAVPGPARALDLDAVSDYVPALDDGLALDYGPLPDNEAARDYGKALNYDAPAAASLLRTPEPAPAPHLAPAPRPAPSPRPATVSYLAPAPPSAQPQDPGQAAASDPAQDQGPATLSPVPPALPQAPATAHVPAGASVSAAVPAAAHAPPAEDHWAHDLAAAPISPATYWRRRLVALAAGIVVLTVLVWAVSGTLQGTHQATSHGGKPSTGPRAAHGRPGAARGHKGGGRSGRRSASHGGRDGHPARGNAPKALPGSAAGRARAVSATAGRPAPGALSGASDVLTMAGPRQQQGSAASRTPHRALARAPGHQAMARARGPHIPACGRGEVVLSLVSPRYWYQPGRWPLFGVDAVSTASRPCRFNMGSRFATVVVTSGRARIWGSADCVHGTGSQSVVLSRGVPAVRWIYWDRATSSPGCRPPHLPVRQGAYTAIAFDGQLSSQVMVFILGRPGTSLP